MSLTHDYATVTLPARDLNATHVLVGESGGLSAVYACDPDELVLGCLVVVTEHGELFMSLDDTVEVLV